MKRSNHVIIPFFSFDPNAFSEASQSPTGLRFARVKVATKRGSSFVIKEILAIDATRF